MACGRRPMQGDGISRRPREVERMEGRGLPDFGPLYSRATISAQSQPTWILNKAEPLFLLVSCSTI